MTSRRPSPLFLLSAFPSPSRCQGGNVTALLSSQGHFFVGAVCLFRRGINERPSALDRQLRTPTKGRIRNTPRKGKGAKGAGNRVPAAAAPVTSRPMHGDAPSKNSPRPTRRTAANRGRDTMGSRSRECKSRDRPAVQPTYPQSVKPAGRGSRRLTGRRLGRTLGCGALPGPPDPSPPWPPSLKNPASNPTSRARSLTCRR